MTIQSIITGCREGRREAQRALYDLTADRIYKLLLRMTHNADDAFDLAQDTFLRVFDRIGQFDGSSQIETWVHRVAVNEALQFLRRRKRGDRIIRGQAIEDRGASGEGATDLRLDMESTFDKLPDEERMLLTLRYYQELNYAEIAEVLEIPAGTVASGLNRARRRLGELMKEKAASGLES